MDIPSDLRLSVIVPKKVKMPTTTKQKVQALLMVILDKAGSMK
jgi:hypothetical protein